MSYLSLEEYDALLNYVESIKSGEDTKDEEE